MTEKHAQRLLNVHRYVKHLQLSKEKREFLEVYESLPDDLKEVLKQKEYVIFLTEFIRQNKEYLDMVLFAKREEENKTSLVDKILKGFS